MSESTNISSTTPARKSVIICFCIVIAVAAFGLLQDELGRSLTWNTLLLILAVLGLHLPTATLLAFWHTKTDLPFKKIFSVIVYIWLLVPVYLIAGGWLSGFGRQGWWTQLSSSPPIMEGWPGAIFLHSIYAIPWSVLFISLALRYLNSETERQLSMTLAPKELFRQVTLKQIMVGLTIASIWTSLVIIREITITDRFQVRTVAEVIYTQMALTADAEATSLKVAPIVAFSVLSVSLLFLFVIKKFPQQIQLSTTSAYQYQLGKWKPFAILFYSVALLLIVGVPLGNLIYKAGIVIEHVDGVYTRSWSFGHLVKLCCECLVQWKDGYRPGRYLEQFQWTLGIAFVSSICSVLVALLALLWAWKQTLKRNLVALDALAILATPAPALGFLMIFLFNRPMFEMLYDRSIFAPVLAQFLSSYPLVLLILFGAFYSIPKQQWEVCDQLGLSKWQQLKKVIIPQRYPVILISFFVAMVMGISEISISILVYPPRVKLLSIQIFQHLHTGVDDLVAALHLVQILLVTLLFAAMYGVSRLGKKSEL